MAALTRARSSDAGFTAIELIIAIVILGIITLPLLSAFVLGIGTSSEANQRTQNSADAQLLSAYFESDVASSDTVNSSPSFTCGDSGTSVVTFDWDAGSGVHRYVAYLATVNTTASTDLGGTAWTLTRDYCTSPNGPVLTSYSLANTLNAVPQPTCDGATCGTSSTPSTVSMTISEFTRKGSNIPTCTSDTTCVNYTLQATRRVATS